MLNRKKKVSYGPISLGNSLREFTHQKTFVGRASHGLSVLGKHCSGTLLTRSELKKNPRILIQVHLVELSAGGLGLVFLPDFLGYLWDFFSSVARILTI